MLINGSRKQYHYLFKTISLWNYKYLKTILGFGIKGIHTAARDMIVVTKGKLARSSNTLTTIILNNHSVLLTTASVHLCNLALVCNIYFTCIQFSIRILKEIRQLTIFKCRQQIQFLQKKFIAKINFSLNENALKVPAQSILS